MIDNVPNLAARTGFRLMDSEGEPVATLPIPADLAAIVIAHVERDIAAIRRGIEHRGGVHSREDTFEIHRHLQAAEDLAADYERKFKDVRKHLRQMIEEALVDAVGEQDGIPAENLTVPDWRGDIRITRKITNTHRIEQELLLPAFAAMFADQHVDAILEKLEGLLAHERRAQVGAAITEVVLDALRNIGELGKFDPQVSKVRAYADALARNGHDGPASVVAGSVKTTRDYQGITTERKTTR